MEAQRNDPDSSQDLLLQRVQKALRDNNRVDQINRESQGFKISKIDTETLNKLDDTAMISSTIDERTGLPAVDIDCKKGFIIRYTDPNTGEKQYVPHISLDSDTKQLKYFGSLKSTVHSTGPEDLRGEHNRDYMSGVVDKGDIFTLTSKINGKEKQESFTIMSLATAEKEKRADMHGQQDNEFSIEEIDQETLQTLNQYVDITTTSEKIRLTIKDPFNALTKNQGPTGKWEKHEAGKTLTVQLANIKEFKLEPGVPRSGGHSFLLKQNDGTEHILNLFKPWGN